MKKIVLGQIIALIGHLVQYERRSNVYGQLTEGESKVYLLGFLVSTATVLVSYLRKQKND